MNMKCCWSINAWSRYKIHPRMRKKHSKKSQQLCVLNPIVISNNNKIDPKKSYFHQPRFRRTTTTNPINNSRLRQTITKQTIFYLPSSNHGPFKQGNPKTNRNSINKDLSSFLYVLTYSSKRKHHHRSCWSLT